MSSNPLPEAKVPPVPTLVVGPHSIRAALELPRRACRILRVDINSNCNIHCAYCEVGRGPGRLALEDAERFYREKVESVRDLIFGCAMEPTLDPRLVEHLELAGRLLAPKRDFGIQTNGILLDRIDAATLGATGLNLVSLSIDTIDAAITRELRDGTDVDAVLASVDRLRRAIPGLAVMFSSVVTAVTLPHVPAFLEFAISFGVREVWFREVTFVREPPPEGCERLRLSPEQVEEMSKTVAPFVGRIPVHFIRTERAVGIDRSSVRALRRRR